MKVRVLVSQIQAAGCIPVRVKGSHQVFRTPSGNSIPLVINHQNAEVTPNVLASVRRALQSEGIRLKR